MQRKITVTGANKAYFTVLAVFLSVTFLIGVISSILRKDISRDYFHATILFTQFALILTPVLIYLSINKLNIKEVLRLNRLELLPTVVIILIAIPALYVMGMFNSLILYFLQFIGEIPKNPIPVPQNIVQLIIGIAVVGISPAICEESLHRGVLLKAYERRGSIKAVVISAIMFGFFHFDITNFLGPIFLGILIGYYVLRTNSIFAGVFAHFIHNSILEVFAYLSRNEDVPSKVNISVVELGQNIITGMIGLVIILLLLKLFNRVTRDTASYSPPISSIRDDLKSIMSHWPIVVSLILYVIMAGISILGMVINKFIG